MKRTSLLLLTLSLCASPAARAQDAATEERLNKLSGQIEDLIASLKLQKERVTALTKELENVREQSTKPTGNYASQEDLKRLTESVKEIDRKRIDDNEKIRSELLKLGKTLSAPIPASKKSAPALPEDDKVTQKKGSSPEEKGFKYTIQKNDTLSVILQAYRDKNIKVTMDQVMKANPGLNPTKLRVGQEIFIPAPAS